MDLIPGLPNHLVETKILSRLVWKDLPSVCSVNKIWHSNLRKQFSLPGRSSQKCSILAIIHLNSPPKTSISYAVSVYHSDVEKWERLPAIPGLPFGAPMAARCVFLQGGHLFVLGGRNPITWEFMSDVFSINLRSVQRIWERHASMNTARSSFACLAIAEDKILVAGGQGDNALALASAEVFYSRSESWEVIPHLNNPRNECIATVINNDHILILGGYITSSPSDECNSLCEEDADSVITRWDASAETIRLGYRQWQTVEAPPIKKAIQRSPPSILCGQLQCIHRQAVRNLYERCERHSWTIVEGKIALKVMEERGDSVLLAGLIHGEHVFGMKYCWGNVEDDSSLRISFCEGVVSAADRMMRTWKELWCPFDFGPVPFSCCLFVL